MKTWYIAVCDLHGEAIDIFVSNPSCTAAYLSKYDEQIQAWLEKHGACEPRLLGNDIQKEKLYDAGWTRMSDMDELRHWLRP